MTKIVRENIACESRLHADESRLYTGSDAHFAAHETVHHSSGEYVRDDIHTNTIEGYFSIFKRGMSCAYQHCGEKHLHRYLAEFDFRYNTRTKLGYSDAERRDLALAQIERKPLTYRSPHSPSFEAQAKRFLRWRKKNWKPPKRKAIRRWFR